MSITRVRCPECGFAQVHCSCKRVTLDDIKRSIGHDKQCVARVQRELGALQVEDRNCDCTRRGKIALLERLQEPTEGMKKALIEAPGPFTPVYFAQVFIKAAEEAK